MFLFPREPFSWTLNEKTPRASTNNFVLLIVLLRSRTRLPRVIWQEGNPRRIKIITILLVVSILNFNCFNLFECALVWLTCNFHVKNGKGIQRCPAGVIWERYWTNWQKLESHCQKNKSSEEIESLIMILYRNCISCRVKKTQTLLSTRFLNKTAFLY